MMGINFIIFFVSYLDLFLYVDYGNLVKNLCILYIYKF